MDRVRFARLSRIKIILGCAPEEMDLPDQIHLVVEDDDYLILDVVINWVCHSLDVKDELMGRLRMDSYWHSFTPSRIWIPWRTMTRRGHMRGGQISAARHI